MSWGESPPPTVHWNWIYNCYKKNITLSQSSGKHSRKSRCASTEEEHTFTCQLWPGDRHTAQANTASHWGRGGPGVEGKKVGFLRRPTHHFTLAGNGINISDTEGEKREPKTSCPATPTFGREGHRLNSTASESMAPTATLPRRPGGTRECTGRGEARRVQLTPQLTRAASAGPEGGRRPRDPRGAW